MTLKNQFLENTDTFIKVINNTPDAFFNTKPGTELWSVADVLEHVYRSEFGIPRLFTSQTKSLTNRAPDELVDKMKMRMLNFDKKMKAKGVILPKQEYKQKAIIINKFQVNREKIANLIDTLPAEELCLKYAHPVYGYLTRLEWIHFSIFHALRHKHQIERIQSQFQ